jgi:hypothetical protein
MEPVNVLYCSVETNADMLTPHSSDISVATFTTRSNTLVEISLAIRAIKSVDFEYYKNSLGSTDRKSNSTTRIKWHLDVYQKLSS